MSGRQVAVRLALAGGAALAVRAMLRYADRLPVGSRAALARVNHRGEPVSLVEGPVVALAATTAAVVGAPALGLGAAAAVAGLAAGAVGLYDDLIGARPVQRGDKGFRGHLVALRQGRVSTGLVKVAGIGAAGLLAGRAVSRGSVDTVLAGGVVAGTANLVNLLD
ncbi:MAG TPA: hypothetical protein VGR21_13505, partial [Cryptosporangiaceae bacterium]|nr:hypothetical protein [Cryptosporangiaceae bacterium]